MGGVSTRRALRADPGRARRAPPRSAPPADRHKARSVRGAGIWVVPDSSISGWGERIGYHLAMADFHTIPSIERLRQRPAVRALESTYGGEATTNALRAAAADVRAAIKSGATRPHSESAVAGWIEDAARMRLGDQFEPSLAPV